MRLRPTEKRWKKEEQTALTEEANAILEAMATSLQRSQIPLGPEETRDLVCFLKMCAKALEECWDTGFLASLMGLVLSAPLTSFSWRVVARMPTALV